MKKVLFTLFCVAILLSLMIPCSTVLAQGTWSRMKTCDITSSWLGGVWGSSASDVFAMGFGGTILHYNGSAWSAMSSGTTKDLGGVWGSSASDVFAVGFGGTILHYNGSAWSPMTSGTTEDLTGVWGSSASDVFAVGWDGDILHYTEPAAEVVTATGTGTASFSPVSGTIENLAAVPEGSLPSEGKPGLQFPHGFFSFDISGLSIGEEVVVTIELPSAVPAGSQYWKYHASEGGWIQIPMGSDNGDNIITITLVDGGLGDDDLTANGVIVDQGGPGRPGGPPAPPSAGCFIATAAYGSHLDSHVETLRDFRDSYLVTNPVGSALVSAYYKLSPPVAQFIDDHPALKPMVRVGLLPAVAMSTVAVSTTLAQKVAIAGSLALVSIALAVWLSRRRGRGVIS